jgi:F0F1-type ATP synthase assembly protein I
VRPPDAQNSYGELMRLAIQASSIVGGMVIPGLIGAFLDSRLGTQFCAVIGIGLGVVLGTMQLLFMARHSSLQRGSKKKADDEDPDRDADA